MIFIFFFSSRRRHTRWTGDWSSDVCSSDLPRDADLHAHVRARRGKGDQGNGGLAARRRGRHVHAKGWDEAVGRDARRCVAGGRVDERRERLAAEQDGESDRRDRHGAEKPENACHPTLVSVTPLTRPSDPLADPTTSSPEALRPRLATGLPLRSTRATRPKPMKPGETMNVSTSLSSTVTCQFGWYVILRMTSDVPLSQPRSAS